MVAEMFVLDEGSHYVVYVVLFHWFGGLLVGIGRAFRETNLAIVSGFSDPPGQI